MNGLYEALSKADVNEKKEIGKELAKLKNEADEIFREVKDRLNQQSSGRSLLSQEDMSIPNSDLLSSSFNFLSEIRSRLINLFHDLDFALESGREIVSVRENFDDLNVPVDHPSRSDKETFYIDENTILKPHCTVNSIRILKKSEGKCSVLKVATIGNVYRRDDETSRHTHQFSQLDFLWLQKGLTVSNLKYFLIVIFESIFGKDREYRFRNSYFPFTQPSVEIDMKCVCGGNGECRVCNGGGWLEVLGAGLFRKHMLKDAGYSEEYACIAGGLGLERLAMLKYSLEDIRDLYTNSFDFLDHKHDY